MTDKQWVIHFCDMQRLLLIRPSEADKSILIMQETPKILKHVFDGKTWKETKKYLQDWLYIQAC